MPAASSARSLGNMNSCIPHDLRKVTSKGPGVGVTVGVGMTVDVGVGAAVGVTVGVGVRVGVGVDVGVGVGVVVGVDVGVEVGVGVGVRVEVGAGVGVGIGVGLGVRVGMGVNVGAGVDVGAGVGVAASHAPSKNVPTSKKRAQYQTFRMPRIMTGSAPLRNIYGLLPYIDFRCKEPLSESPDGGGGKLRVRTQSKSGWETTS